MFGRRYQNPDPGKAQLPDRVLRNTASILTAGGYQAQTCEDPREALSLLEQNAERIDFGHHGPADARPR